MEENSEMFSENLVDMVRKIAGMLIDDYESMKIVTSVGVRTVVLRISVKDEEVGKIIGKRGNTIDAIRTLLKAAGGKHKHRVELEISSI